MKESITIKHLGPLHDIAIGDIRPFTVIIGQSGSGKSLLMKVISLMRFIYKRVNVRAFLLNSGIKRSPFRIRLDSMLHDDLKFYLTRQNVEVEYRVTFDEERSYFVKISGGKVSTSKNIDNRDIIFTKESWVSETRNIIPVWKANPANNRGWLGFFFHETMNDFDEAAATVRNVDMDFLGAKIAISPSSSGVNRLMLSVPDRHEPIELRYASSGMQTAAPLALLTHYFASAFSFKDAKRRSVLSYLYEADQLADFHPQIELSAIRSIINMHVEEPELSLDPLSQIALTDSIVATAFGNAANRMTVMMATHSPYIVNAINLIISRKKDGEAARLDAGKVSVIRLIDGRIVNLLSADSDGLPVVDTSDLSAPMESIYDEYCNLTGKG